ncbi:DUF2442 domain-containing protein [Chrysiogenes arsenatis]|uniref:DUF2442 domain-containing protein n=1 Tax=Chrysiogenes arsenatis TaxID=309797 RepID=UPI00041AB694|nr:DUF2442 domain-containing protein [Chrysiogenes arsenatis]
MRIADVKPLDDLSLLITASDGIVGLFDVKPYLDCEAFEALKEQTEFRKVRNGGYFVEWDCGADLSADTIAAKLLPCNGQVFF